MFIVIMAGGSGTRFWPVSRASHPKQFLSIVGEKPMIVETYDRIKPLAPDDKVVLVVGERHRAETERLFAEHGVHILVEPVGRNTAPCIGLAAAFIDRLGGRDEPVVILPADHYIARPDAFRDTLDLAVRTAANGSIVTLGIVPTRPETGYGYIESEATDEETAGRGIFRVRQFVEKPDLDTAVQYLRKGGFYWNAGIFTATPETLLQEFAALMPEFRRGLDSLAPAFGTPGLDAALASLYAGTESISFDYAIMEKTSRPRYVVPCECGWSDVGSWLSLYEVKQAAGRDDDHGNMGEGDHWMHDCRGSFVFSRGKRWIAAIGLERVLIVDTEDALLVADLERSQDIKKATAHLETSGRKDLL